MSDPITAKEIRTALKGTTPGPWEWVESRNDKPIGRGEAQEATEEGHISLRSVAHHKSVCGWDLPVFIVSGVDEFDVNPDDGSCGEANMALIAAAPELLARAADRIEQLEQIWLRDLASALDRLAAAQLATAATTCIRCASVLPEHEDDCTVVLTRSILGGRAHE